MFNSNCACVESNSINLGNFHLDFHFYFYFYLNNADSFTMLNFIFISNSVDVMSKNLTSFLDFIIYIYDFPYFKIFFLFANVLSINFLNTYFVWGWFVKISFILVYMFVGFWIFFTSSLWLLYFGLELQWMLFIILFVIGNSVWNGLINYVIFNELVGTLLILGLVLYINIFFSSLYYGNIGFYPFMIPMISIILNVSYLYFFFDPLNNFLYFGSFISFYPVSTEGGNLSSSAMFMLLSLNFYMIYCFGINFLHSINIILFVSSLINFLLIIILIIFCNAFLFSIVYFLIYYSQLFFFLSSFLLLFNLSSSYFTLFEIILHIITFIIICLVLFINFFLVILFFFFFLFLS